MERGQDNSSFHFGLKYFPKTLIAIILIVMDGGGSSRKESSGVSKINKGPLGTDENSLNWYHCIGPH
jgi:hypothetical protein